MAIEFSLVPGESLDIIGIPDLEVFKNFIDGDLGIADGMYDSFMEKATAGVEGDTLNTFTKLSENKSNMSGGLKSFEKTIFQTVFETQKPYIEIAKAVLDGAVIAEDIIAAFLGGVNEKSLKPISNEESLYSKLNKIEGELNEVNELSQDSYNTFKNITEEDKLEGISISKLNTLYKNKPNKLREIDLDINGTFGDININDTDINYDFTTVSTYYSTGTFIEGIPYKYTYRYIIDNPDNNNSSTGDPNAEPITIPRDFVDDKKPILIFDIWVDDNGDGQNLRKVLNDEIEELPWDIQDKWVGDWESWSKEPLIFKQEYISYTTERLNDELSNNNITDPEVISSIQDMVINSIPFNDTENNINFYNEFKKSSSYKKIIDYGGSLSNVFNLSNKFGIKPKKIDGIWYDPEVDYHTQLIKVSPSTDEPVDNNNITYNPLSNKYDSNNINDVLLPIDYDSDKFVFMSIDGDMTHRVRHDESYIDGNQIYILDKKHYYIIEGVYKDRIESIDTNGMDGGSSNSGSTGGSGVDPLTQSNKYYKFGKIPVRLGKSIAYVISRFIKFASTWIAKIISLITKAIKLLTKPFNFIFEILLEKAGDVFDVFSPEVVDKVSQLQNKTSTKDKKEFVENDPMLNQIISFDTDGNYRLITDGTGFTSFIGVGFGIGMTEMSPKLSIDVNPNLESLISEADVYINDADSLTSKKEDKAESINLRIKAMEKLQIAQNLEPNNIEVQERIDKLQSETGVQSNMLFQSIIEIVSLPIKIILKVIEYILDFFKSLSPMKLPVDIPEFLTFKWIMDFFKPSTIMELLGIKVDPSKLSKWKSEVKLQGADEPIIPQNEIKSYDTSEVLSTPFMGKLDTYDTNTLPATINGGSKVLLLITSLFKFIQEVINAILCFLFNVFNIDTLINCPKINLAKFNDESLSSDDINTLLEQDDINFLSQGDINNDSDNDSDNGAINDINSLLYLYDVQLEDGTIVLDLNYEELQSFIANHKELQYKYNF